MAVFEKAASSLHEESVEIKARAKALIDECTRREETVSSNADKLIVELATMSARGSLSPELCLTKISDLHAAESMATTTRLQQERDIVETHGRAVKEEIGYLREVLRQTSPWLRRSSEGKKPEWTRASRIAFSLALLALIFVASVEIGIAQKFLFQNFAIFDETPLLAAGVGCVAAMLPMAMKISMILPISQFSRLMTASTILAIFLGGQALVYYVQGGPQGAADLYNEGGGAFRFADLWFFYISSVCFVVIYMVSWACVHIWRSHSNMSEQNPKHVVLRGCLRVLGKADRICSQAAQQLSNAALFLEDIGEREKTRRVSFFSSALANVENERKRQAAERIRQQQESERQKERDAIRAQLKTKHLAEEIADIKAEISRLKGLLDHTDDSKKLRDLMARLSLLQEKKLELEIDETHYR